MGAEKISVCLFSYRQQLCRYFLAIGEIRRITRRLMRIILPVWNINTGETLRSKRDLWLRQVLPVVTFRRHPEDAASRIRRPFTVKGPPYHPTVFRFLTF